MDSSILVSRRERKVAGRWPRVSCTYAVPPPKEGAVVDPTKVNVVVTPNGAASSTVPRVGSASDCGSGAGWHYETSGAAPSKLVLCPSSCSQVASADATKVEIVTGCKTVIR